MTYLRPLSIFLFLAALAGGSSARADGAALPFADGTLPLGWRIEENVVVPQAQLPGFAARLGGNVTSLTNQVVSVNGLSVRVNAIAGATDADAEAVEQTMLRLRGADFVAREGRTVYEVAGQNVLVARRVFAALGVETPDALWEVSFRVALVDDLDYTAGNRVFNHFLALEEDPADESAKAAIAQETKSWTFGSKLRLLDAGERGEWSITPAPVATETDGLVTVYSFQDAPRSEGIPYVDVKSRIRTSARFDPGPSGGSEPASTKRGLGPTPLWPSTAPAVREIARAAGDSGPAPARVLALLRQANTRVRYGGATGTRDGVLAVLERGYGRCWDRSDVLITLCRAAGIPARQVGGWVPPIGAGHVWTEVHVEGGWLPVDATTTWLGVSQDYIPLFASEDGPMPIVYLAMPRIRRVEREPRPQDGR